MGDFETVVYEKNQGIAWVTLNRPRFLNAVNIKMRDELYEVVTAIKDDPEVMVAIVKGVGERAFSAGADITEFGTAPSRVIARQVRWERDLWGLFLSVEKLLIAAIHGFALGAGLEIAMCCDLRVASEDAQLGLPEVSLGMIPAAGGSQTLPRLIPRGKAAEMVILGKIIDAQEALRVGLVNKVVPRSELLPTAEGWAQTTISRSQVYIRCAKQAVFRGMELSLDEGLRLESRLFASVINSGDLVKAYDAHT